MKKLLLVTAALLAAVAVCVAVTLPPPRLRLPPADDGTVAGLLHVHTNRSDGLGTPDEVAAAAARAGLRFVVFTDHGDATRTPDPPQYRSGVLCFDGVEISTSGGHYIALDMPASPYPLAGEPRDVVEDVRRLGGFGIAAHPDSPKPQLRWRDWTAPIDAAELLNLDTSWRVLAAQPGLTGRRRLLTALLDYPFRSPEVVASLIQPPSIIAEWAAAAAQRDVIVLAGADAHAKVPLLVGGDPQPHGFALSVPDYDTAFRVMSIHLRPERPLSNDAASDAALIVSAMRKGHLYTAVDGVATPPAFTFTASNASGAAGAGDTLRAAGGVTLRVQSNAPPGWTTIVHDGAETLSVAADTQDLTVHGPDKPGVFWAEIVSPAGAPPVTWIRSNPIYVRGAGRKEPVAPRSVAGGRGARQTLFDGVTVGACGVEHDVNSVGAVEVARNASNEPELRFRFGLAGGNALGQFTALVCNLPAGVGAADRLGLSLRAEKPMRVSVQFRDATANRWQRSIYVDENRQQRVVMLDDLVPVGAARESTPDRGAIRAVMFVVDTTNTRPGTAGRIWIAEAALQR